MRIPVLAVTTLLVAALVGCGTGDGGSGSSAQAPDPTPAPSTGPPPPSATADPTPGEIPPEVRDDPRVQAALEDARGRAGIVPTEVVIAAYSTVTWNDGSLGCPKKGMSYTQMTVPGELLLLRADQRLMAYHSAKGRSFTYCAAPSSGYTVAG